MKTKLFKAPLRYIRTIVLNLFSPLAGSTDTLINPRISADWSIYLQFACKISSSGGLCIILKRRTLTSLHKCTVLSVQASLRDYITPSPMAFCDTPLHDKDTKL